MASLVPRLFLNPNYVADTCSSQILYSLRCIIFLENFQEVTHDFFLNLYVASLIFLWILNVSRLTYNNFSLSNHFRDLINHLCFLPVYIRSKYLLVYSLCDYFPYFCSIVELTFTLDSAVLSISMIYSHSYISIIQLYFVQFPASSISL